jgi:hypothetical protein
LKKKKQKNFIRARGCGDGLQLGTPVVVGFAALPRLKAIVSAARMDESFLLLFFKKEALAFPYAASRRGEMAGGSQ